MLGKKFKDPDFRVEDFDKLPIWSDSELSLAKDKI
jgi:hypothetical protein